MTLWLLGYPDQARARLHEGLALAHALSHPFSLAWRGCSPPWLRSCRRDVSAVYAHAEAAVALATVQGFHSGPPMAPAFGGGPWPCRVRVEEGVAQVRQGIADFRATGAALTVPYLCTLLADVADHLSYPTDGLQN